MEAWGYLVIIGVCLIGFGWLAPKRKQGRDALLIQDMEAALDRLFLELDEENKKIAEWLAEIKQNADGRLTRMEERVRGLEKQVEWLQTMLVRQGAAETAGRTVPDSAEPQAADGAASGGSPSGCAGAGAASATSAAFAAARADGDEAAGPSADVPPTHLEVRDDRRSGGIRARYPELFRLHAEGKSVEQIARKLGMNKGEVMLIVELARREEQAYVQP